MDNGRKILLVVEGAKSEPRLFKQLFEDYNLNFKYDIFCYETNIYELYRRMFERNDAEDLDLLLVLREKDKSNPILNENFSDIILAFDFDPQDTLFTSDKIKRLLEYFNESTENGKLYLNYPMVESYRHFKSLPDSEFLERIVSMEILKNGSYKQLVGQDSSILDIRKISKEQFNIIISQSLVKAIYLIKGTKEEDIKNMYQYYNDQLLLERQIQAINNGYLFVLNTSILFIIDYNISLIM